MAQRSVSVSVYEWDNEMNGEEHDLSYLETEYSFTIEDCIEDCDDLMEAAINRVTELTGWCIKDCDVWIVT